MKERKCPRRDVCWGYKNNDCEECSLSRMFKEYEDKIKALREELAEVQKITASKCLRIIHEIGGCDATDDFSMGWDKAIDAAYNAISGKYEVSMFEED